LWGLVWEGRKGAEQNKRRKKNFFSFFFLYSGLEPVRKLGVGAPAFVVGDGTATGKEVATKTDVEIGRAHV
jgi:hypothetical protein